MTAYTSDSLATLLLKGVPEHGALRLTASHGTNLYAMVLRENSDAPCPVGQPRAGTAVHGNGWTLTKTGNGSWTLAHAVEGGRS